MVALSNCIADVLNPVGVDTLITFTTTEFDVDEHPDAVVIVKL
jgi:hypothetical protein